MESLLSPLEGEDRKSALDVPGWLGQYLLLAPIAKGGMANVYIGEPRGKQGGDGLVALKVLLQSLAKKNKFVDMFRAEGRLGLLLDHPNIARTLEVGKDGPHHFIAMEYVDGQDLGAVLRFFRKVQAPMPLAIVMFLAREILAALHYAHTLTDRTGQELHLVNRDVSPANVMIGFDGRVKLIDFGIAQATLNYRSQIGSIKGKIPYMSPEQVRGLAVDARSDLFSLGTILYQMLTGIEPFRAPTEFEQMERVRQASPVPVGDINRRVDPALARIVASAMAKEPSDRFPTAQTMSKALDKLARRNELRLSGEELHRFMLEEFSYERAKIIGQVEEARDSLQLSANGMDTDPTDPSPRRSPSHRVQGETPSGTVKPRARQEPRWLLPAVIVLTVLAIILLAIALLR